MPLQPALQIQEIRAMKQSELIELLAELAAGDLESGALIYDHPCSVAVREIQKLEGNLAEVSANEAALLRLLAKRKAEHERVRELLLPEPNYLNQQRGDEITIWHLRHIFKIKGNYPKREQTGVHRGHPMILRNNVWLYQDNCNPVSDDPDRECGHCDKPNTPEGHDACLGTLPGVMNACCGHGTSADAYIQYEENTMKIKCTCPETEVDQTHSEGCPVECEHSFYQGIPHNGEWRCTKCHDVIESWQHHNLVISERDTLLARVKELEEHRCPCRPTNEEVKGNITIEFARRDDCLDKMVPSDLRVLVAKRDTLQTRVRELEEAGQAVVHAQKQRDDASDGLRWYKALRLFNRAMANLASLLEGDEK